jgi:hypothetical protein
MLSETYTIDLDASNQNKSHKIRQRYKTDVCIPCVRCVLFHACTLRTGLIELAGQNFFITDSDFLGTATIFHTGGGQVGQVRLVPPVRVLDPSILHECARTHVEGVA